MRRIFTLAAVLAAAVFASGRAMTAADPPALAAAAPAVIDVIVSDARGGSVAALKPSDFTILDGGVPLAVANATLVHAAPRRFAIFLDEFHTPTGEATDRVRDALRSFVEHDLAPGDEVVVFKPLDSILTIKLTADHAEAARAIDTFSGRRGDYAARTAFERNFIAGSPERVEAARVQIAVSALHALATHLGSLGDGRTTLLIVGDGLGRRARTRADQVLPSLDSVRRAADRARVAIYSVEVTPLVDQADDAPDAIARRALRTLAEETGGRSALAGDDVAAMLARMGADASAYYSLTLGSASAERDGRFHALAVRVAKPGVTVRTRAGYWSESVEEARVRAFESMPPPPRRPPEPARRISPLIRPWFGMVRGTSGGTRVIFVWEPAPAPDRPLMRPPARVALRIAREDGSAVFDGVVRPTTAQGVEGEPTRIEFEQPPGRLRVQMTIEDAASRPLDTDVRDLIVGAFAGPITLGTAEVLRARSAREFRALASDPRAVPAAAREFSRNERLLIRLPVYTAGAAPEVSARLVSRFGGVMRELAVTRADAGDWYQVDVPLAGLAMGDYTVEFSASTADGRVNDRVAIRVTS